MTTGLPQARANRSALWSLGFRPFFLAASLWSALALALWVGLLATGSSLPSRFDPLTWHIHAMFFGFVLAAAAGFLLTAIPNWTGRRPVQGFPLFALVVLWLCGRIVCLCSAHLPLWFAAAVDLAFPAALATLCASEIVAARNWRNLMMTLPIAVLGVANLLMYLELAGVGIPAGLGWRLALAAVVALIAAIGGRITPAFTRNWLANRGERKLPAASGRVDGAALAVLVAALPAWAFLPGSETVAALLLLAGLLNLWRLARWRGTATLSEPLLAVLHIGHLWIVCGVLLLGMSILTESVPQAAAVHALTAGAIGTMIVAVMTRVSRGHTGRALEADRLTTLMYTAIVLAGLTRVVAEFAGAAAMHLYELSALLWVSGFVLFVISYGPLLILPRADGARR